MVPNGTTCIVGKRFHFGLQQCVGIEHARANWITLMSYEFDVNISVESYSRRTVAAETVKFVS